MSSFRATRRTGFNADHSAVQTASSEAACQAESPSLSAFSAGKLTLTEAESVIELIDAKSRAALALSRKNLDGALSDETDAIYKKLRAALGSVYAGIDFPDEDLETLDDNGMAQEITDAISMLSRLMSSYKTGHAVIEGVPTVICGKPNVGKSTMLNTLLMRERAIVTDIPGTTRDVVSETAVIGDVLLSIRDTAGIRESGDEIERIGILKSVGQIEECELVIGMFDASRPCDGDDERVISLLCDAKESGRDVIAVLNKCDLIDEELEKMIKPHLPRKIPCVFISSSTGEGLQQLKDTLWKALQA